MKVKVTRISRKDTDKNGIKLISKKYGKPYYNIGIQIEGSDDWYTTFANYTNEPAYNITEGGEYHISVTEKVVGDRTYKNFKMLTAEEVQQEADRAELAELRKMKEQGSSMQTAQAESHMTLEDFDKDEGQF